jgi:anti-sigma regulatory factor (Ser/Thr protein kinase)
MRELSLHILDLVQNSIEAGATSVSLEIVEDTADKDVLIIRVHDNGCGMNESIAQRALDPFVTTRTTRKVGMGLPLIDMSTRMCDGYLKINSVPGMGTTVEAVYKHSHLDRPPLGIIVVTIKSIIVANPQLDFHYLHCVNKHQFTISNAEIMEILGDIPLSHPDVLVWLDEYLSQNLLNLYGGGQFENN